MKYKIGDVVEDKHRRVGIVGIKWNDGGFCAIENDATHPNPKIAGHWSPNHLLDLTAKKYDKST